MQIKTKVILSMIIIVIAVLFIILWGRLEIAKIDKSGMDFSRIDVHPPLYYYTLYAWSYLNPGMFEYHWGQQLSVLFGLGFLIFAYLSLKKLFGRAGEIATIFLALCMTYLHYFTEVRMYSLVFFLSAVIFYGVINNLKGKHLVSSSICMFLLPLTHYYAAIAIPFYVGASFIILRQRKVWQENKWRWIIFAFAGSIGTLFAGLFFALPQRQRVFATWFQPSSVTSWPSAVLYAYFMIEGLQPNIIYSLIYLAMLIVIVVFLWKALNLLSKKDLGDKELVMILMGLTAIFPLGGLAGAPILGGEGFAHLYHHRFFLVITWLFAAMSFVVFTEFLLKLMESGKKILFVLATGVMVFILIFMIVQYDIYAHHELENLMRQTPCSDERINIAHESPFSALPYEVWARQHGCNWWNFVSTRHTPAMLNGGGGDAMPPGTLFFNKTLPDGIDYYYVYAAGSVPVDGNKSVVVYEDGVELWYITRQSHEPGQKMVTWYDNSTKYTRVRWENI